MNNISLERVENVVKALRVDPPRTENERGVFEIKKAWLKETKDVLLAALKYEWKGLNASACVCGGFGCANGKHNTPASVYKTYSGECDASCSVKEPHLHASVTRGVERLCDKTDALFNMHLLNEDNEARRTFLTEVDFLLESQRAKDRSELAAAVERVISDVHTKQVGSAEYQAGKLAVAQMVLALISKKV